ncbi:MAG TPA: helix-turn-helix transcriptional regulator [Anaerolineaceae bacterium]|nr:helix-turn-helix transcriptional regulator [Anaerolineaceae bacterium]
MSSYPIARKIRSRKLGLLLVDARSTARRTPEECAAILGIPTSAYQAYEQGLKSPSLPEIELLSYYLDIPLDHFWGNRSLSESRPAKNLEKSERMIPMRQYEVGERLREARLNAGLSLSDLSEKVAIPPEVLEQYEAGMAPISIPELETLASELKVQLDQFMDSSGLVGLWRIQQENIQRFLELPQGLQEFVSMPVNRPYVELAQRLSGLSVERLRAIAEGLLEITF